MSPTCGLDAADRSRGLRARHVGGARRDAARAHRRGQRRRARSSAARAASIRSTAPCSVPIRSSSTSARPAASGAKALVVRIDSPGGSSVASDVIWRELMITKDQGLPIIVSMSDLAASGGYYMAMAGDVIVAQPGTLTGSIGIYTGKFVTGGTLRQARRERRDRQAGEVRRDVLAGSPVHPRGTRQGARVDAGHLRSVRRAGRRIAADDARRRSIRSGRAGSGPGSRRARSAWSMSSAG